MPEIWLKDTIDEVDPVLLELTYRIKWTARHDYTAPNEHWRVWVEVRLLWDLVDLTWWAVNEYDPEFHYGVKVGGRIIEPENLPEDHIKTGILLLIRERFIERLKAEVVARLLGEEGTKVQREYEEAAQNFSHLRHQLRTTRTTEEVTA